MKPSTIAHLTQLNKAFYHQVGAEFSVTRAQPWLGWQQCIPFIKQVAEQQDQLTVLDIGCGNARFLGWLNENLQCDVEYTGIDANAELLQIARQTYPSPNVSLQHQDLLTDSSQNNILEINQHFDLVVAFGFFHHVPSFSLRQKLLHQLIHITNPAGLTIISFWQFDHLQKLLDRQLPLSSQPLDAEEWEKGDHLLTWNNSPQLVRYCHLLNPAEQEKLFTDLPIEVLKRFSADGADHTTNDYWVVRQKP